MKRLFVLGLVLAILAVGFTAFANPINVGGSFTTSTLSPINVGGSCATAFAQVPAHAEAYGLRAKLEVAPRVLLSPINVGGS